MHKTDAAASFRASWLENASELLLENQFFVLFSDFVTFFSFFFKREGELPSPHKFERLFSSSFFKILFVDSSGSPHGIMDVCAQAAQVFQSVTCGPNCLPFFW